MLKNPMQSAVLAVTSLFCLAQTVIAQAEPTQVVAHCVTTEPANLNLGGISTPAFQLFILSNVKQHAGLLIRSTGSSLFFDSQNTIGSRVYFANSSPDETLISFRARGYDFTASKMTTVIATVNVQKWIDAAHGTMVIANDVETIELPILCRPISAH